VRPPLACCALGALIVSLAACDLSPRTPEDPGGGGNDRLVNLSDPDSVLLQIQVGLTDGRINSYMNAFTQDFVFHPDERDSSTLVQQTPGVFDDWTYAVEQQVMQIVINQYSARNVSFATAESTVVVPGSVIVLDENYDLTVDTERYQGRAELQMRLTGNEWRIFMWIDRRQSGSELSSWSLLKGENR
jgi:hypothetical protein